MKSRLEETLAIELRAMGLPEPKREHHVCPGRRWRFDFAWPDRMLAVEVDGGQHVRGRHNRPAGFENDCSKINQAQLLGWTVLRYTGRMVMNGTAAKEIGAALSE